MRKTKNHIAVFLALSILICCTVGVPVAAVEQTSPKTHMIIDSFFAKEYEIWNKSGEDITNQFYNEMTPYYQAGDYNTISDYMLRNISEAISMPTSVVTYAMRSTERVISQSRDFYKVVDDEVHGFEDWNAFYGEVELRYYVDTLTNKITSADKPIIVDVDMERNHGDNGCEITISKRSASVNSAGSRATFSFHLKAEYEVASVIYPEVDQMGLSFLYNADFSFVETNLY